MKSIIAKIPIKEDKLDEAIAAVKELMVEVAKEEGTLYYTLNVSEAEPATLVVIERYKDDAAIELHSASEHFQQFVAKGEELFSGALDIVVMDELACI